MVASLRRVIYSAKNEAARLRAKRAKFKAKDL